MKVMTTRPFPRKPWTAQEDAELTRLAESKLNRIAISRTLNRSVGAAEARASRLEIRLPSARSRPEPLWLLFSAINELTTQTRRETDERS